MTTLIKSVALLLSLASVCLADGFRGDTEQQPTIEPFVGEKAELFRFSRSATAKSSPRQIAKYVQQQQAENDQVSRQQVEQIRNDQNEQQQHQQQVVVANELPAFSSGSGAIKTGEVTKSEVAEAVGSGQQQQQQQHQHKSSAPSSSSSSSSVSSSSAKKSTTGSSLFKTITTTSNTITTKNNQDQPQVAQIKEIRVHTVPLSEAVHYANYMVVPTSSGPRAAHLEESSSSSSSSSHKSSSSTSETEQVAVAPAPTVVVDPPPAAVAPDCVFHRLVVERPVSSQLVVNVAPEVKVSHSSSSSHSSKIVSQSAVAAPESTVYSFRRVFVPPPVYSARVVQVPAPSPAVKEEHFRSESQSSREESHGLGHSISSSSSSSSSRSSKSSSTTTSQTAALVQPPPQVRTVTTIVRQAAPLVAAPLVEVRSSGGGQTSDVSVDHRQSGPNYNYGYSIKQHSSEPAATKGVVVGDRVVYLN